MDMRLLVFKLFFVFYFVGLTNRPWDRDINYLVMDYLVTNGYPAAAKRFAVEANLQPKADIESIQERVEIRSAIHSGDIQTAVEKINELSPQVRSLHCSFPVFYSIPMFAMIIPVSCTTHIPIRVLMIKTHLQSSV